MISRRHEKLFSCSFNVLHVPHLEKEKSLDSTWTNININSFFIWIYVEAYSQYGWKKNKTKKNQEILKAVRPNYKMDDRETSCLQQELGQLKIADFNLVDSFI